MSDTKPAVNEMALQRAEQPTPLELIHRAVQSGSDVTVMEKLLGLQERWEGNEARKAFDVAVAKAKAEIPIIRKGNLVDFTTSRGHTSYRYEDLATIATVVDPILSKYGLSYRWRPNSDAKSVTVTCILSHSAGHSEENTLYAPHDASGNKNPIQAVGSAVTYLQRYTLKAALGLAAAADDDARSASPPPQPASQRTEPEPRPAVAVVVPEGEVVYPNCEVKMIVERSSKPDSPKKWTAYFVTFNDGNGADRQAATFDRKVADLANELTQTGEHARIVTKPGRKQGSRELVSLEPIGDGPPPESSDNVPMDFDKEGNPVNEVIP